jgi:hypothetical protein
LQLGLHDMKVGTNYLKHGTGTTHTASSNLPHQADAMQPNIAHHQVMDREGSLHIKLCAAQLYAADSRQGMVIKLMS